eukprot:evm.model.NODE_29396_length_7183_cov_26.084923.3
MEEADDRATLAMVASIVETPPSKHKAFNPTMKKVSCPQHKDVIVARRKLRTGVTTIPCWRCIGEAALPTMAVPVAMAEFPPAGAATAAATAAAAAAAAVSRGISIRGPPSVTTTQP